VFLFYFAATDDPELIRNHCYLMADYPVSVKYLDEVSAVLQGSKTKYQTAIVLFRAQHFQAGKDIFLGDFGVA